ncbi:MAG: hypothetical protein HY717_10900 [Planctomycetes bacterium]|nr:hypothetical protein [Planctomycetota bacterium]
MGLLAAWSAQAAPESDPAFYLPENPQYTIVQSALDSARFTIEKTLKACDQGHLASISSFVDEEARIMDWHAFGPLEGPGWAANAAGGAYEIYIFSEALGREREWKPKAIAILDHVLDHGFIDEGTGFITGYRHIPTGKPLLNFRSNSEWFCPGSMAKVAFQLLVFADRLPKDDPRAARLRRIARRTAGWIVDHVEAVPNGWYPRRATPQGQVYKKSCTGGSDSFWQTSADGLFIVQLLAALAERGLADHREEMARKVKAFIDAGGIFGSINHDTYDPEESVSFAVAFRTLRLAARVLKDDAIRRFAYEKCLRGLDQFKMREDRNGVATRGLLYMEKSWDTAYLWENAEAALAFFEAADENRGDPERAKKYELDGLTILRAISKHHHGPHGFLTEGVDWNNHVGARHHFGEEPFGDIRYTEPFLNNQHLIEPVVFYLERLAQKNGEGGGTVFKDREGNMLFQRAAGAK